MNLSYRARRRWQRAGIVLLILLILLVLGWLCCAVWLERYVVYTRDGATIDLSLSANEAGGVLATPPSNEKTIEIYFNEGANTMETSTELTQLAGYYISGSDLSDIAAVRERVEALASGTPVMIDLKNVYGTFYYSSGLAQATTAGSVDIAAVDDLISDLVKSDLYVIARIPAFKDRAYGLEHVSSGIYHVNGKGLWPDSDNCYWLNPTDSGTLSWIMQIVEEVKGLGFDEVVLSHFSVPTDEKVKYTEDRQTALLSAANTFLSACGTNDFAISFTVKDSTFPLPEGRCRMVLENVDAKNVGAIAARVTFENPEVRLVFLATTNDTRFNDYGVLRPLDSADLLEEE